MDQLSHGRVGVSFASGWHAVDFVLRPENYEDRKGAMLAAVDTVRQLWRGEEVEFPDGTGEKQAVRIFPAPVQPELPVWITAAGSPETFRAAGRLGLARLQVQYGSPRSAGQHRATRQIRARVAAVVFAGLPPLHFGFNAANPCALKS